MTVSTGTRHTGLQWEIQQHLSKLHVGALVTQASVSRAVHARKRSSVSSTLACMARGEVEGWLLERLAPGTYRLIKKPAAQLLVSNGKPVDIPAAPLPTVADELPAPDFEKDKDGRTVKLVELIGTSLTGEVLVRDEDGRLYRMVEL